MVGDPSRTRTCGLRFRKPLLYPPELWDREPGLWPTGAQSSRAAVARNPQRETERSSSARSCGCCCGGGFRRLAACTTRFVLAGVAPRWWRCSASPLRSRQAAGTMSTAAASGSGIATCWRAGRWPTADPRLLTTICARAMSRAKTRRWCRCATSCAGRSRCRCSCSAMPPPRFRPVTGSASIGGAATRGVGVCAWCGARPRRRSTCRRCSTSTARCARSAFSATWCRRARTDASCSTCRAWRATSMACCSSCARPRSTWPGWHRRPRSGRTPAFRCWRSGFRSTGMPIPRISFPSIRRSPRTSSFACRCCRARRRAGARLPATATARPAWATSGSPTAARSSASAGWWRTWSRRTSTTRSRARCARSRRGWAMSSIV